MPLTDSLIGFWPLDEASGDALDATGNGHTLTETSGTISAATGLMYSTARDFEAGDTEDFRRADSAALSHGDFDFTYAFWIQPESWPQEFTALIGKDGTNQREFLCYYRAGAVNRFNIFSSHTGLVASQVSLTANTFGAATADGTTWYFVVCGHDAANDRTFASINNGAADTAAVNSAGIFDGTGDFEIGGAPGASPTAPFDGRMQALGRWNRLLTSAEKTWLYNLGSGRTYTQIVAGMSQPLYSELSSLYSDMTLYE